MNGTDIEETRVCDFGSLYTVHIHRCANADPEACHPELIDHISSDRREERVREIKGITAAQLRGTTLFIAVDNSKPWSDVHNELNAVIRSS